VLLDAPCTALGIRPRLQQTLTLQELLEAAAYQRQLLAAAVRLLQPGGYLVYSTCSISPGEREGELIRGGRSNSCRGSWLPGRWQHTMPLLAAAVRLLQLGRYPCVFNMQHWPW
jgi:16S rRNA C967 or C1407 C5-methylase (RsmB/RsmF family)